MSDVADDKKTLWDKIKGIRFGMLTHRHTGGTHERTGLLHSHPLTTQNKSLDEGQVLYFFISEGSELASGLRADPLVNVSYADPGDNSYVSVAGLARVLRDPALTEQLWSPAAKVWFPKGPADPDLALLAVDIEHAEYRDVKESKMTQLFRAAKAALAGERPTLGEHKTVDVR
jgi:general stress protein 26